MPARIASSTEDRTKSDDSAEQGFHSIKVSSAKTAKDHADGEAFWSTGPFLKYGIGLLFIVFAVIFAALLVYFFVIKSKPTEKTPEQLSGSGQVSEGYRQAAKYLNAAINESADPCVDFAQFACGQWVAKHPIPDDKTGMHPFQVLRDLETEHLKDLYSKEEEHASRAVNQLRRAYRSCNASDHDMDGVLFAATQINSNFREWPLFMDRSAATSSMVDDELLNKFLLNLTKASVFPFHEFSVGIDPKNVSRHVLFVDQPKALLSPEYYRDPKAFAAEIKAAEEYVLKKLSLFATISRTPKHRDFDAEVHKIMEFDGQLAAILALPAERRDPFKLYNPMTFGEFSRMTQFDYGAILRKVMPKDLAHLIHNDTPIVSTGIEYLKKLNKLIAKTDKEVLANYMVYRYFATFSTLFLGKEYDAFYAEYQRKLIGQQKLEPRWQRCVNLLSGSFSYASSHVWGQKYFDQTTRNVTASMIADLKAAFKEMLDKEEWMTEPTKKRAHKKVDNMIEKIGYHPRADDIGQLDEYYKELEEIDPEANYLKNSVRVNRFNQREMFRRLIEKPDRYENTDTASTINAYNYPDYNSITMPAGILQAPFFHPTYPKSMNYGAIGVIIGHEITHGFDDNGCNYDYDGTLENWWDMTSKDGFQASSQCIVKQYGNIMVPEINLKLNGKNTAGENIADNGGIKESYTAYQKFVAKNGAEPEVPGLKYSHEQLFFLAYAQNWCVAYKTNALKNLVLTNEHAPGMYRTNVVLQNMPEFASAFNCAANSPMNPASEKRCSLW